MENRVFLIGRVGKSPELDSRVNKNGNEYKVTYISLATSSIRKDPKTKEPITDTKWHRILFYNEYAEYICKTINTGDLILVSGELNYSNREENGFKFKTASIIVTPNKGGYVRKIINQKKRNMVSNKSYDDSNNIPDGSEYDNQGRKDYMSEDINHGYSDDFDNTTDDTSDDDFSSNN